LTKICDVNKDDWDLKVPTVLWAYRTTWKKITRQTPFKLVYGHEAVVPLDYLIPSLCIATITDMTESGAMQEILAQLIVGNGSHSWIACRSRARRPSV
jgi:hypothetical protein